MWSKNAIKEYGCLIIKKNLAQGKGTPKVITYIDWKQKRKV